MDNSRSAYTDSNNLNETERNLYQLILKAPVAMGFFSGPQLVVEIANEKLLTYFNIKRESIINTPLLTALPFLQGTDFNEAMQRVYTTGRTFKGYEWPSWMPNDDSPAHYNFVLEAIRTPQGSISGVMIAMNDVTEQALANRRMLANEQNMRNLFMQAPVGVALYTGEDMVVELVNDTMLGYWGKKREDLMGRSVWEGMPEGRAHGLDKIALHTFKTGTAYQSPETMLTLEKNGKREIMYISYAFEPRRDENGDITGIMGIANDVTAQVTARQKIEESRKKYFDLIHTSPFAFSLFKGRDLIISIANQSCLQLWGHDESVIGKPFAQVLPETAEQGYIHLLQKVYDTGQPFEGHEMPVTYNREGKPEVRYFNFVYQPQFNAGGQVEDIAAIGIEVTPQAILHKQLRENETQLNKLANAMLQLVWIADKNGKVIYINHRWELYKGVVKLNEHEWEWQRMLHPDDLPETFALWQNALEKGITYEAEHRLVMKDGRIRWHLSRATPQRNDKGEIEKWYGTATDIHEQKLAAERLTESESEFRQLADMVPQIVWTALPNGQVNYFNKQWYEYTGFDTTPGDAAWIPVLHPDDIQKCLDSWHISVKTGRPYQIEYRFKDRRNPGSYRWFLGRAVPVKDSDGNIIKWFGACTDIDDQKTSAHRLENLVAERTAELKRQNEELDSFTYIASHDLQEPLRKIQTFIDFIKANNYEREATEKFFGRINLAAERMSALIQAMLTYSRLNTTQTQTEPTDLNVILEHVKTDFDLLIAEKKAVIHHMPLPVIMGVPFQLHQLFANLISNSLKFAENPVIEIRTAVIQGALSAADPGQNLLQLKFIDNGIGFDSKFKDQIFKLFQRLHGKNEYAGTGIGLSIVKKIAEKHGGRVEADSAPGHGATFTILLPADIIVSS